MAVPALPNSVCVCEMKKAIDVERSELFRAVRPPLSGAQQVRHDSELVIPMEYPSTNHSEWPKLSGPFSPGKRNSIWSRVDEGVLRTDV